MTISVEATSDTVAVFTTHFGFEVNNAEALMIVCMILQNLGYVDDFGWHSDGEHITLVKDDGTKIFLHRKEHD